MDTPSFRHTSQNLRPVKRTASTAGHYDLYPAFPLDTGRIELGYAALAEQLRGHSQIVLDGYAGVFWEHLRTQLSAALNSLGLRATWLDVGTAMHSEEAIEAMLEPFLGGDDPLFGKRFTGRLQDFFDPARFAALRPDPEADITLLYGPGAALAGWDGLLGYVEVPKNEIQYRSRAGGISNLGCAKAGPAKAMYKRFYFVDWVVLNDHKAELLAGLELFIDEQRPDEIAFMSGQVLRDGLSRMSQGAFRARPWFEPGAWGGQKLKQHIPELPQEVPNYAWSFELIAPEQGLLFESDGYLLEVPFEWLMAHAHEAVLGEAAKRFGREFPIRFDYLDTVDGGNLSLQCHPRPTFIREHFGESFTQDETYYIMDAKHDAKVYLGFQEGIDAHEFRGALERSAQEGVPVEVERYVQRHPARPHDLFVIPHGTVHCSGEGTLVLEISATPYIFTFKMYDWLRLDLDGNPRPLNIARAFENLDFSRQGLQVEQDFIAKPAVLDEGDDWRVVHLPTHPLHFYDVHRLEFSRQLTVDTDGSCQVLNLVEGTTVRLETDGGPAQRFSYGETFVVSAAAGRYRLINEADRPAKLIKAFIKPEAL